jgi:hypothetical protein
MMKYIAVAILLGLVPMLARSAEPWTPEQHKEFIRDCISASGSDREGLVAMYCECMDAVLSAKHPFTWLAEPFTEGKPSEQEDVRRDVAACRALALQLYGST